MILKRLKVQTTLGEATNCYIVEDEETKETMVIDPGGEADKILEMLDILEANVKYIYLTHCHGDHIGAVSEVKSKKGGKILIHRDDAEGLDDENINLSACINMGDIELEPDSRVDDRDLIHVGNLEFRVIHTPGHTKGSTSLYCEKEGLLFSGEYLKYLISSSTSIIPGYFIPDLIQSSISCIGILSSNKRTISGLYFCNPVNKIFSLSFWTVVRK